MVLLMYGMFFLIIVGKEARFSLFLHADNEDEKV